MSGSNRGVILALGLILSCPSHAQTSKSNQSQAEQGSGSQLARIAAAIEKQPITAPPDRGCSPTKEDRQSELCAQWKAADAAAESAQWACWAVLLTGLGLLVGGGTLVAAWRAAHWASEAAKETQKANSLQLAPRLRVNRISIWTPSGEERLPPKLGQGECIEGELWIYLVGVGEAKIKYAKAVIYFGQGPLPMRIQSPVLLQRADDEISAGTTIARDKPVPMKFDVQIGVLPPGTRLYVIGEVQYSNGIQELCHLGFARVYCSEERRFIAIDNPDYETDEV